MIFPIFRLSTKPGRGERRCQHSTFRRGRRKVRPPLHDRCEYLRHVNRLEGPHTGLHLSEKLMMRRSRRFATSKMRSCRRRRADQQTLQKMSSSFQLQLMDDVIPHYPHLTTSSPEVAVYRNPRSINPYTTPSIKCSLRFIAHQPTGRQLAHRKEQSSNTTQTTSRNGIEASARTFKSINQVRALDFCACLSLVKSPFASVFDPRTHPCHVVCSLPASHSSPVQVVRVSRNHPEVHYIVKQGEELHVPSCPPPPLAHVHRR